MFEDLNTALQSAFDFTTSRFVPGLLALDPFYISIALSLFGIILVFFLIVFKAGRWIVALIKRIILFGIIAISAYLFISSFYDKLGLEALKQAPLQTILIGGIGGLVLVVSLSIAIFSLKTHAKKREAEEPTTPAAPATPAAVTPAPAPTAMPGAPPIEPTTVQQPKMLTTQALKEQITTDRSLLAVISYVIIAEFGIFSSKTFPAPNPSVGMLFFAVFFFGAFIFIKTSYRSYVKGVAHLVVAAVFAICLSIFLGHFWAEIPLSILLSLEYFGTIALVAVITGIAVSLLMGSRG